ncbi:hypothetical protein [Halomonas piscis]|uniref:hypothetical protein n=1 Tax=Halomonas piscis TaxID=3031727 RepID=UPI00289A5B36|nr:hypothetical protein [Halomonas piscis]
MPIAAATVLLVPAMMPVLAAIAALPAVFVLPVPAVIMAALVVVSMLAVVVMAVVAVVAVALRTVRKPRVSLLGDGATGYQCASHGKNGERLLEHELLLLLIA